MSDLLIVVDLDRVAMLVAMMILGLCQRLPASTCSQEKTATTKVEQLGE